MRRELLITPEPIDCAGETGRRTPSPTAGAVVTFIGVVRDLEDGLAISSLEYEAFVPMAEHQFRRLFDELGRRWQTVEAVRLIHRIGAVPAGAPSLWVEISAPHRSEAFAACQWLIDEMKRVVPIWKRPIPPGPAERDAHREQ
jgi:molybdopterin synthase catalytic subunit